MKTDPKESRRNKVLAVLGPILAVGALAPQPAQTAAPAMSGKSAFVRNIPATQRPTATTPALNIPGAALMALLADGYSPVHSGGNKPKDWGMSAACHKMRRQRFRAGATSSFKAKRRAS